MVDQPLLPDYDGACVANVVPTLLGHGSPGPWMPTAALEARPGRPARARRHGVGADAGAPLAGPDAGGHGGRADHDRRPVDHPTALTSITTGLPPGEHGIVGYRMAVHGEVLNVLRWSTPAGDARQSIPPPKMPGALAVPRRAAAGRHPGRVRAARASPAPTSTASASAATARRPRWWPRSSASCASPSRSSTPTTTGSTRSPTSTGWASTTTPSCSWLDRLVDRHPVAAAPGAALVVTADHGQVEVRRRGRPPVPRRAVATARCSRARAGSAGCTPGRGAGATCYEAAVAHHADDAWVRDPRRGRRRAAGSGRSSAEAAKARLGDVALVARRRRGVPRPARHRALHPGRPARFGSPPAEMLVPLLVGGR